MGICIILESIDEIFDDTRALLKEFEPNLEIVRLKSIKEFSAWTKNLIQLKDNKVIMEERKVAAEEAKAKAAEEGEEASAQGAGGVKKEVEKEEEELEVLPDDFEIDFLVSNSRICGPDHVSLFNKLNLFYGKNEFLGEKERLPIVFTSKESEELHTEDFMRPIFDAVLYHPYDKKVCLSQLNWAFKGVEALNEENLHSEKPLHPIEMLKDVRLEKLTPLGFQTVSSLEIPVGKLAKYYYKPWSGGTNLGIFARCVYSGDHPRIEGSFESHFTYFGISNEVIGLISNFIKSNEAHRREKINDFQSENHEFNFVSILPHDLAHKVRHYLEDAFDNISFTNFEHHTEFFYEMDSSLLFEESEDPGSLEFRYNFADDHFHDIVGDYGESWNQIEARDLPSIKTFMLQSVNPEQRKEVLAFWKEATEESFSLVLKYRSKNIPLTIEKSEVVEQTDEETHEDVEKVEFCNLTIRKASLEELNALKSEDGRLPERIDALFVNHKILNYFSENFWSKAKDGILSRQEGKHCHWFSMGFDPMQFYLQVDQISYVEDHFIEPLKPGYFINKLTQILDEIETKTEQENPVLLQEETILTSVPVEVVRISEVSTTISYYREIEPQKYRKFLIFSAKNKDSRLALARMVGSEKNPDNKEEFLNHFVFFAQRGETNQYVRKWLNEQYVLIKELERSEEDENSSASED